MTLILFVALLRAPLSTAEVFLLLAADHLVNLFGIPCCAVLSLLPTLSAPLLLALLLLAALVLAHLLVLLSPLPLAHLLLAYILLASSIASCGLPIAGCCPSCGIPGSCGIPLRTTLALLLRSPLFDACFLTTL